MLKLSFRNQDSPGSPGLHSSTHECQSFWGVTSFGLSTFCHSRAGTFLNRKKGVIFIYFFCKVIFSLLFEVQGDPVSALVYNNQFHSLI